MSDRALLVDVDGARRGRLRVYLGAAPGVGKTVAMLAEGHRAMQRGRDVVLACFEGHDRRRTAESAVGLPVVGRDDEAFCGSFELDLAAVLERRPQLALVDELAHDNPPGSVHAHRWEDIATLLAAGIDVVSTVDIAELESLCDVAERITGLDRGPTVPDAFVRAADQIELVDMTPEALRRRLAHGNVYPAERVDAVLANQFRPENLAALRQLALLWLADRVEEALRRHRDADALPQDWETKERVVVGITGAPGGDAIVRRAARIAERARAELIGLHVRGDDRLAESALVEHRAVLEQVGGTYREVADPDVSHALVTAARAEGATQLVLGTSRRSRWSELTRGSLVADVLRTAGDTFDVHVVSGGPIEDGRGTARLPLVRRRVSPLTRRRQVAALLLVVVGLPVLTAGLSPFRHQLGFTSAAFCYLLAVVLVATVGGAWPAALAALAGFGLLNWFFADPVRTFAIANNHDVVALASFLVVAGVTSALVDIAARRAAEARRARSEAEALAAMAGSLLREGDPLPQLLDNIVRMFDFDGASVLHTDDGQIVTMAGAVPPLVVAEASAVFELGTEAVLLVAAPQLSALDRSVVRAFADQVALALESRRLHAEAAAAEALAQANQLRSALLSAVSHDLRTPLASIKASASSLLSPHVSFDADDQRSLLQTIDAEADRLNELVGNLLDMSRIQTGALVVQSRAIGLEEVVSGALGGVHRRGRQLRIDLPETLPAVSADPVLLERAVANIIDNAIGWSPPAGIVSIEAASIGSRVDLRVVDRGPGVPADARDRMFQPFQRLGDSPNGSGVGLGLAVARGFVDAMGGSITVDDTPGGGTTMTVSLAMAGAR